MLHRRSTKAFVAVLVLVAHLEITNTQVIGMRPPDRSLAKSMKLEHNVHENQSKPHRRFRGGRVHHPMFEGSGCPIDSVLLVNSSDETTVSLSALFSEFHVETTRETLRDHRTCVITVALEPEENMSIGVAHVDLRGYAYVPVPTRTTSVSDLPAVRDSRGQQAAHASLKASYHITGAHRERIADATYAAGFDDSFYESMDVNPIAWTPCKEAQRPCGHARAYEFRIFATITAAKANATDEDVAIAVDSSDATMEKGLYYQLTARPCTEVPASASTPPLRATPQDPPQGAGSHGGVEAVASDVSSGAQVYPFPSTL